MELAKVEKRFEVLNKADNKETDLYLYGSIGSGWYSDISAKQVKEQLKDVKSDIINVHLNSPGGDVFDSISINSLLRNHKAEIHIYIDGLAASGASIIAMAGDKVFMGKSSMIMIHKAWTFAASNAKGLRKIADDLEKVDSAVLESYTSRFVGEREELEKLLEDETYLTAQECLALGFCDEIIDDVEKEEIEEKSTVKDEIVNKYQPKIVAQVEDKEVQTNNSKDKLANAMYQFLNNLNTPKR